MFLVNNRKVIACGLLCSVIASIAQASPPLLAATVPIGTAFCETTIELVQGKEKLKCISHGCKECVIRIYEAAASVGNQAAVPQFGLCVCDPGSSPNCQLSVPIDPDTGDGSAICERSCELGCECIQVLNANSTSKTSQVKRRC